MELTCRKCQRTLDAATYFHPRNDRPTGYQYECKACRNEINKKYARRGRKRRARACAPVAEPEKKKKKENPMPRNGTSKRRDAHRRELLTEAGKRVSEGRVLGDTSRSVTFDLALIIEQQLRLFNNVDALDPLTRTKVNRVIEDVLFETKQALGRARDRIKRFVDTAETVGGVTDLMDPLHALQERRAAQRVLGVDDSATPQDIKCAYRRLAAHTHPDKQNGNTDAMQQLNHAYTYLTKETANG